MSDKAAVMALLGDRSVAYKPILAEACGGVIEALMVSQFLYWTDRGKLSDGWIWKSQREIQEETGLTRSNQETARRHLLESGILEEKLAGVPATMHYRLNMDVLADCVIKAAEMRQARLPEVSKQERADPADYPETTQETTHETTKSVDAYASTAKAPAEERPPPQTESALKPDTWQSRMLFARLDASARARGRRGPQRFPTLETKQKFDAAAKKLDGKFTDMLTKALEQGCNSVVRVTSYVAKCAKPERPTVLRVGR